MPYFIRWLDNTFKTRKQTEELLTPEVQDGTITNHDYEIAVRFLPGYHRYYGEIYGVGLGGLAFYYGLHGTRLFTQPSSAFSLAPLSSASGLKPHWKPPQLVAITVTAYFAGKIIGQVLRLRAHIRFTRGLENPAGFENAMENIYSKGPEAGTGRKLGFSVGWDVPSSDGAHGGMVGEVLGMIGHDEVVRRKQKQQEEELGGFTSSPIPYSFGSSASTDSSDSTSSHSSSSGPDSPLPSSSRPLESTSSSSPTSQSRWDKIRAANAKGAGPSAWDAIRQNHERQQVQNQKTTNSPGASSNSSDSSRSEEQARFDAMLEAERSIKHNE